LNHQPGFKAMDLSDDDIDRAIKWYFVSRFLWGCFVLATAAVASVCFVVYWAFKELSLELSYQRKYGADWQTEFEKYHGTVSHAHTQIAICVSCMLALVAVLIWFCRQTFHRHKQHLHRHRKRIV
jgi:hypothetical protein